MIPSYYHAPTYEGSRLMRGADEQPRSMFSYVSLEERVPADHPLRAIRRITDRALEPLSPRFGAWYINFGRPSIPPEKLLRALLLQALYTIRSERQLMEQMDYNLLFRWFVGLGIDDPTSPSTPRAPTGAVPSTGAPRGTSGMRRVSSDASWWSKASDG